ncbi:MAG: hypothetical protein HQ592_18255 [Planctomycetes bacterium]|nr:hypothetical protein [Planctomycetota bacterium]
MDCEKLDKEFDLLSEAFVKARDKYVVAYQLIANLLAALVLSVVGGIALMLLGKQGSVAAFFGFIIGVIALGAAGLILSAGAGAVHRRVFFPPESSYESPWESAPQFLRRNCTALAGGYCVAYAALVVAACILLIPAGAAKPGSWLLGQVMFAVLLIPMVIVAAAAIFTLLVGIFAVPAEVALREQDTKTTVNRFVSGAFRLPRNCLCHFAIAFVAASLVALPIFTLLRASSLFLYALAGAVAGVTFTGVPIALMAFFSSLLIAAAAALPMAYFTVIVGLKYRKAAEAEEEAATDDAES